MSDSRLVMSGNRAGATCYQSLVSRIMWNCRRYSVVCIQHAGLGEPRNCWTWLDWVVWARSGLTSFPVVSNKGQLLLLLLLTNQNCCWEMSLPVSWIPFQPMKYLHCCAHLIANSA